MALGPSPEAAFKVATKRVVVRVKPDDIYSWDHSKLGGRYSRTPAYAANRPLHAILPRMTSADRRFTAWVLVAFGPLFVLGGFLFAFTVEGALLVFLGLAMLVTGALLFSRLPLYACVFLGLTVFAALTVQMASSL